MIRKLRKAAMTVNAAGYAMMGLGVYRDVMRAARLCGPHPFFKKRRTRSMKGK